MAHGKAVGYTHGLLVCEEDGAYKLWNPKTEDYVSSVIYQSLKEAMEAGLVLAPVEAPEYEQYHFEPIVFAKPSLWEKIKRLFR